MGNYVARENPRKSPITAIGAMRLGRCVYISSIGLVSFKFKARTHTHIIVLFSQKDNIAIMAHHLPLKRER